MSRVLTELIGQLRTGTSQLDRLRTLALGWRTVRELSAEERSELALHLGVDGAADLVEQLATRNGRVAPTELLEAVHAARSAEPGKLRSLMSGLRRPETRRQLLSQGLQAVERRLIPDQQAAEQEDEETLFEAIAEEEVEEPGPAVDRPSEPEPPAHPEPAAAPPVQEPPVAPPPVRVQPAPAPRPEPPPPPDLAPPPAPRGPEIPAPQAAPTRRLQRFHEVLGQQRTLGARLRLVRRGTRSWAGLDLDEVRSILAAFAPAWARRRALATLLEHGLPADTGAAITLARELQARHDRMWVLAALLRQRAVTSDELDTMLDMVETPVYRRRLQRLARLR